MSQLAPLLRARVQRIVYLGTPEIAVSPLRALVDAGFIVELVVTGKDKRRGRGAQTSPNPVKAAALELGIAVTDDIADVAKLEPEGLLGVVVAYGSIIGTDVLQQIPMINIHYSALPRWRGAAPVERTILAGDATTAVCIIQVVKDLDAGDILATSSLQVMSNESADELRTRLGTLAIPLLLDICNNGVVQQHKQSGEVVIASKINSQDRAINWNSAAEFVVRQVRVGGAFTFFAGKRIKVLSASVTAGNYLPGVINCSEDVVVVGTGMQCVQLHVVQPEGKQHLLAHVWANGARLTYTSMFGDR